MITSMMKTLAVATLTFGIAAATQAVVVVPVSATASSEFSAYEAPNAIDANPLSDWASLNEGAGSTILLDLGGSFVLTGASMTDRVTSGSSNNAFFGGLFDFTIQYELTLYSDTLGTISVGTYTSPVLTPPQPATGPADFLTTPTFAAVTAASVRYTVLATHGANPGLSDISFVAGVPDPRPGRC